MKSSEIIESILDRQGRTKASLAADLGINPIGFYKTFSDKRKDVTVGRMARILSKLGYKLVAVPAATETLPAWYACEDTKKRG